MGNATIGYCAAIKECQGEEWHVLYRMAVSSRKNRWLVTRKEAEFFSSFFFFLLFVFETRSCCTVQAGPELET